MDLANENVILDTNLISNEICNEILQEECYGQELGEMLMVSATKNLLQIDAMKDFSINLLRQIAENDFATPQVASKTKVVSIDEKINALHKDVGFDINVPIHDMFETMSDFVCDALAS